MKQKNASKKTDDKTFIKKVREEIDRLQKLLALDEDAIVIPTGDISTGVISGTTGCSGEMPLADVQPPMTVIDARPEITSAEVLGDYKPGDGILSQTNNYTLPKKSKKKTCQKRICNKKK